ncbi:MAG: phosphatidate cytidylyltransferase [Brevinematales bacterium]|nr:phosphatidate cytidylyltransferase [Brevinematales bacterium]
MSSLPIWNIPIYIAFIYLFFISILLIIMFETIRMFESKYFYIPKIKKTLFIIFSLISVVTISSLSLFNIEFFDVKADIGSVFTIVFSLYIIFVLLNLAISSLNVSKHNYLIVDGVFSTFLIYLVVTIGSMLVLRLIDIENGTFFLAFTLGVGWFSEAGGLIIGKTIGRIKLSAISSSNKTLEGTIGMIIFGILGGIIFKLAVNIFGYENPIFLSSYEETIILSSIVVLFCFFGDIIESTIKRFFEAKDSSNILMSLGGVFDVFDGVMFASFGVLLYYFVIIV